MLFLRYYNFNLKLRIKIDVFIFDLNVVFTQFDKNDY